MNSRKLFLNFKQLSDRWKVSVDSIESYLLEGKIKKFEVCDFGASNEDIDRIYRLLPLLNEFAGNEIRRLIETNKIKGVASIAKWSEHSKSDRAFEAWLLYYDMKLAKTRLVIPYDEVIRCDNELKFVKTLAQKKNMPVIAVVQHAAQSLYTENKKWPRCLDVVRWINQEANKDGPIGALISSAGKDGISLSNGEALTFKTVQNWLTDYRKSFFAVKKSD